MLVRDRMITDVVTATPDMSVNEALSTMRRRRIWRLPVLDGRHVVGIVTWTDMMRAQPSPATTLATWEIPELLEKAEVRDLMTRYPDWIAPDTPLEDAATLMRDRKIGGLPVMDDGVLVGIITESDIFEAFIDLLGARTQSYRITVEVEDRPAAFWDISVATRLFGIRLHSVSTYPGAAGRLRLVLRVADDLSLPDVLADLQERGVEVIHAVSRRAPDAARGARE